MTLYNYFILSSMYGHFLNYLIRCGKAYRHSQKEMSQCQRCRKFVHSECGPEVDRTLVQRKKDMNFDYEYLCPPCKISAMEIDSLSESNPGSVS